ncbi:hypothetical protein [Paraflavitalea sp. CAU 1676]|uniref:hypothetical protein n=1 Tax=Paraflavitalea sp. CAU 1676 TaxID=3032598 RepID=UPI0023DA77B3|nr:hypothetical protein [Paraflavitalea sp. CAU 1676]MDF2189345.1 hypothetical protein [Paraflavitalea sp. CAU 1676]
MTPSTDIERLLFTGRVDKISLQEYLPDFVDDWNFVGYSDFKEVNWLNTPGPIYTTITDNCGTGQPAAMNNVGGGEDYREIIFRQPVTRQELEETLTAALIDPFGAYYFDGNLNWTTELIKEWWLKSNERISYILDRYEEEICLPDVLDRPLYGPREGIPDNYKNWLDFYQIGMKEYLEWYIFKLTNQRTNLLNLNLTGQESNC